MLKQEIIEQKYPEIPYSLPQELERTEKKEEVKMKINYNNITLPEGVFRSFRNGVPGLYIPDEITLNAFNVIQDTRTGMLSFVPRR